MPLQLSDAEITAVMNLAQPIDRRRRDEFLREVVAEIEASRQTGEGWVHRVARQLQRKYFDPPQLTQLPRRA
jgi:hypothetical protein